MMQCTKKNLNLSLKDIEILMSPSMRINFEGYLLGKVNHLAAACILSKKKKKGKILNLYNEDEMIALRKMHAVK